jgi:hypothetical protein
MGSFLGSRSVQANNRETLPLNAAAQTTGAAFQDIPTDRKIDAKEVAFGHLSRITNSGANHSSRSRGANWPESCDDERQQEGDSADEAKLP